MVRKLLRQLGDQVVVGLISNTHSRFKSINGWALSALGIAPSDDSDIAIYEALIDDDRQQNVFGLLMSLNMLIETRGGFDYTGADCQTWLREAGFRQTRVEHLIGPDSMVIGVK